MSPEFAEQRCEIDFRKVEESLVKAYYSSKTNEVSSMGVLGPAAIVLLILGITSCGGGGAGEGQSSDGEVVFETNAALVFVLRLHDIGRSGRD